MVLLTRPAPLLRWHLHALAYAGMAALMLSTEPVRAQTDAPSAAESHPAWHGAQLQRSLLLQEQVPSDEAARRPVYISGHSAEGSQGTTVHVRGHARLRRAATAITGDDLSYNPQTREVTATGDVLIDLSGDRFKGTKLQLDMGTDTGHFNDVHYWLREKRAHGQAARIDFLSRDKYIIHDADYTTCQRDAHDPNWRPAWRLHARELTIDREADVGVAKNAKLQFMGVTILPVPYLSFPLTDRRKSGFLVPTFGLDSVSGFQYEQPYYWNIAPNRDATFSTTLMDRRGANFGGEFRYLEPNFSGELAGTIMPGDRLRHRDRWSAAVRHHQRLDTEVGPINFNANINRVSDDNYWRDFPRSSYGQTNRLLPADLSANWSLHDLHVMVRTLKWQTLQDPDSVILPPYNMLPQINARYTPWNLGGNVDFSLEMDTTRFRADPGFLNSQTDGQRSYAKVDISRPWLAPQGFITPSIQLFTSHYHFDRPLHDGERHHNMMVPTYSLDSGLVFERDTSLFGRNLLQTLEPRAFYTYTPYRNQNMLPIYDTSELDFTFASIYSPESFVGNDRFADNNLLTLGLTSRLLQRDTGAELVRASIAQRMRFQDQRVTMPGEPPYRKGWSDILLGGHVNWSERWATNGVLQYDFDHHRSVRYTLMGHYKPGPFQVLNAAYRMKRDSSKQAEFGWQWPLSLPFHNAESLMSRHHGQWYTVGRLNYSMQDRKLVDTIVGFEYNGCCWVGRVVVERLQNSLNTSNTRVLFQLELGGLSRINIGANPLNSIYKNVPYYDEVRPQVAPPSSRFTDYDQ